MAENKPFKLNSIYSDDTGFNLPEMPSMPSVPGEIEEVKAPEFKLDSIYSEEEAVPSDGSTPITSEELADSESLAQKAYRLADVAGEGLLRGWKSEIQSGIENVAAPYWLGREADWKDFVPFDLAKSEEEKADDLAAQREGFDRYKSGKEKYEQFTEQTKEMMPRASYVSEVGGGLLPYALGGPGAGVLANAALGGVEGGLTAGGKSEADILSDEFKEDVKGGAAFGTVLGGVATKLMKAAPKTTMAALTAAGATPAVTGEQDPEQMAATGGIAALLTALATRGRKAPAQASGILSKMFEYGKEGIDLTSKEALDMQAQKLSNTATKVGTAVDEISNVAGKKATDVIFSEFDNQINQLGDIIAKGSQDKDSIINSLKTKVWKDLENHIQKFKASNPDKQIDIGDIFENTTGSLRKAIKESITDPAELQAANKTIDIINDIGKIEDNQISITLKEMFSPLGGKPKVTKIVEGIEDPVEREVLQSLSPEELQQAGFQQTTKPFKTVETPEVRTSTFGQSDIGDSSLVKKVGDQEVQSQRTVFGKQPEDLLRERLKTPFSSEEPSAFLSETVKAPQTVTATNRVFERLFPGRSDLNKVSLPEILDANVKLNEVIKSSKSDVAKRLLIDAKKQLAQREQQLVAGTEFADVVPRRELYGALKDAEGLLKTDDVTQLFKLVDDMAAAKQQGRSQDFDKAFSTIRSVNPEYASNLENILYGKGGTWKNLIARQKANPVEKLQTLKEEGLQVSREALGAGQTLQEIEALKKMAGTMSPKTGQPTNEAYKFAQNLGELRGPKAFDPKVRAEMDEAIKIIKDYDPDLANSLLTEGAKDADVLRMMKIIRGESDLGFIPSTFQGALIKVLQVFGIPKLAYYSGKGLGGIQKSASTVTNNVVNKTQVIKDSLNQRLMDGSFKSGPMSRFENALQKAQQRGDGALNATVYMLSQQYPEFREYMKQFEEE